MNTPTIKEEFQLLLEFFISLTVTLQITLFSKWNRIKFKKYQLWSKIVIDYIIVYLVSYWRYLYGLYKIYTINKIFSLNKIEDFQLPLVNKNIIEYTKHLQGYINYHKHKKTRIHTHPSCINDQLEWFLDIDLNQQQMITYFKTLNKLNLTHSLNTIVYKKLAVVHYYIAEANKIFDIMYREAKKNIYY